MLPQMMEFELEVRQQELERELRQRALLRALRASQTPKPPAWRRAGRWFGVYLVRMGTKLERLGGEGAPYLIPEATRTD